MIEKYIFEDVNILKKKTRTAYEDMISRVGYDYLDTYHYKIAGFYTMLQLDKEEFQQIAPICFSYGKSKSYLLPNHLLLWMTEEQMKEMINSLKDLYFIDYYVLNCWKENFKDEEILDTVNKIIKKKIKITKHQLYLKSDIFYEKTNMIGIKDLAAFLMPNISILPMKRVQTELAKCFEGCFITDNIMDYQKTLERINQLYSGNSFEKIKEMIPLNQLKRKIFLEYYEKYGSNTAILQDVISELELRYKIEKIPSLKLDVRKIFYNYEDARNFIVQKLP